MQPAQLDSLYPCCGRHGGAAWQRFVLQLEDEMEPQTLAQCLDDAAQAADLPPYLADLARLEWAVHEQDVAQPPQAETDETSLRINPTLCLLSLQWQGLCTLLQEKASPETVQPRKEEEFVLLYKTPKEGRVRIHPASKANLLALKVVAEGLERQELAREAGVAVGKVDRAVEEACAQGLLLKPRSGIRRTEAHLPLQGPQEWQRYLQSDYFTLQWHVTQACDLHCKHCYDRSEISPLTLDQGIRILDQFREFILAHHVQGQITFTGGNPLLYPHFQELYHEASQRNFAIAILGNPAPRQTIEALQAIQPLAFYQVSLEGLAEHNDAIRGKGHFQRVMEFLEVLRELSIYSMVMLTLTRENMDQVLPLAEILRDRVDLFTFNRLSQTGEGAALAAADRQRYRSFLVDYLAAARTNKCLSLKDNLLNILKREQGEAPFGGCTGYGCGAAFNFCSLLPNGDLHACRKFPSPIGNVLEHSLLELYHSPAAQKYRLGPEQCRGCAIRPVCGGCLAVIQSSGLDITADRDPYCFFEEKDRDGSE